VIGLMKNYKKIVKPNRLVFGSLAMKHWFPDSREPNDYDIITDVPLKNEEVNGLKLEFHWTEAFKYLKENNKNSLFVDKDLLYTIKLSHAAWDINWEKTMKDIEFLKSKYCKVDPVFYKLLYTDWENLHGKKKVKMNVQNEDFFKGNIKRKYDHEWLHKQFMFNDRPMNERIRYDLSSPICSKDLWDKLTYAEQLQTALEEIFVLTAERFIFVDKPIPTKIARIKTLKKMITSTTSGWFNFFLIEHFNSLRIFSEDYFKQTIIQIKEKND